ncbi:unnamed protein product [Adineta steineri]|uniref:Uncharacterized protein n=1 Tax=Adineta steineri TaxID=433720 RepID=A0A818G0Y2_9BILA|nr:unnamed protein product [Adineta steineri]CAF3484195.1 unnamed protein product [Adineta steineri]
MSPSNRSKSPPKGTRPVDPLPKRSPPNETINTERLKMARDEAERAMKEHKIFTIIGPYPALRESLRRRGWIEKFYRGNLLPAVHGNKKSDKKNKTDEDDEDENDDVNDDDDLDEHPSYEDDAAIPPWEENDGYYGLLSRLVRTAAPNLIWSVRASYDTSTLNKDQMVNHYSRNGCFTTKVGICNSLRNLQWFHPGCAEEFFPRCYKLSHEDDKVAYIDDYRLTACISFLKLIQNRCKGVIEPDMNSILAMSSDGPTDPKNPVIIPNEEEAQLTRSLTMPPGQLLSKPLPGKTATKKVPSSFIEFALKKVIDYTISREHEDIDILPNTTIEPSDEQWTQFIDQFYAASHSNGDIEGMENYLNRVDEALKNVEPHWPQYHIDGTRNIWILKPGAKSRGRGIVVYDRLDDILKLCSSTLTKDGKFVVQKYIERPLLIHNIKFDIRQWFLVTDWNPLTIWMYKDCYFRFCTEHFSLETRQQNVHLCNHSIQKNYKNNSNRHNDLPAENMWTNAEFIEKHLRPNNSVDRWDKYIYPAMKNAIICSMLVAQDTIDPRKNSFELYGADFMLGEDLKPWLIEINCSPTMARSTEVTAEMCDGVLEDTCKVMIDRRYNRTADTGRFELIHRGTPVPVPIYVGIDLRVEGKICRTGRPAFNPPVTTTTTTTQNNNNNNNNTNNNNNNYKNNSNNNNNNTTKVPASAPPQSNGPSPESTTSAENHSTPPSQTNNNHLSENQLLSAKSFHNLASLRLRREMSQPALSRVELTCSTDSSSEKNGTNDNLSLHSRPNVNYRLSQQPDIRQKQYKLNPARLSIEYLPVRQISRSRVYDNPPSPKGVRFPTQLPFNRQYQRAWVTYKTPQLSVSQNTKLLKPRKTTIIPSHLPNISNLSIPATIAAISAMNENHGHSSTSSSALAVV